MPPRVAKLVLGTLYIIVKTLLKLKQLPDEDRQALTAAEEHLALEIVACAKAERTAERVAKLLEAEDP
jgi:RNA polymerase-interacting CarD/CdnL/TRCF family regulator